MTAQEKEWLLAFRMPATRKKAFEAIVRAYNRPLFAHLMRYFSNREDAEDVLQTVWVKVWRALDNFRGDSKLSTWLFTITSREAYSFHRSRKMSTAELQPSTEPRASISSPDSEYILQRLQQAVEALPEKQQSVFVMRYFEEMSYEEMAQATGTSVGALKASYHHAVRKIERFLSAG